MPAKFNVLVAVAIPLVPLIPLLACGGDSKSPDASIHVIDTPGSGSNGSNGSNGSGSGACHVAASLGSPTFTMSGAFWTAGSAADATNILDWQGVLPGTPTQQILDVQIYGGCGSGNGSACGGYPTPDWPTTFGPKSGLDVSMAPDAGMAVLADLSGNMAGTVYLATAGTLNITGAQNGSGHTFSGTASNVTFKHYDFPQGATPTPDPDGCTSTLTSLTFTGTSMFTGRVTIQIHPPTDDGLRNYLAHRYQ